jgi:hypothetical protein
VEPIVGIFTSSADAERAAESLSRNGIPRDRLSVLTPRASEAEIHRRLPTADTEQPGVGKAVGGVVGGAVGATAGVGLGALAAAAVPGFGALAAAELLGAALLGAGGAVGGAAAGGALDEKVTRGLPKDELYLYENALSTGHSIVFALADESEADRVRTALAAEGAESLDAARESWWVGIRDAERADYERDGGDFAAAEPAYRRGFEMAMRPAFRGRSYEDASNELRDSSPEHFGLGEFKRGYERGQRHLR